MARRKESSDYSSRPTDSEPAVSVTSTLDGEHGDIMIFYHQLSNMKDPVKAAKTILSKNYTVHDSFEVTLDAGRPVTDLHFTRTRKCTFKIFVLNKSFFVHDMANCSTVLDNSKVCVPENTLFLCRKAHSKRIPEKYGHFSVQSLTNRVDGVELAEKITSFVEEHKNVQPPATNELLLERAEEDPAKMREYEIKKGFFSEMIDKFDRRRFYILCACINPIEDRYDYEPLSFIPWLKVFDFDAESEDTGLLKAVKDKLHEGRLVISSTAKRPKQLNDKVTDWTIVASPENLEPNSNDHLAEHIATTSKFCAGYKPPTLIILYYQRHSTSDQEYKMLDFVIRVSQSFNQRTKIVLCQERVPEDANSCLAMASKNFYVQDRRIIAPFHKVCEWISEFKTAFPTQPHKDAQYQLPKLKEEDDDGSFFLQTGEFNWLSIDVDVVTSGNWQKKFDDDAIAKMGIDYLKGGDLGWEVIADGSYDVSRAISQELINFIKEDHIEKGVCGVVTLYHAPGSGGSTVGRRVVWELRNEVPCLALRQKTVIRDEFKEKIKMVRDKSNLPVLLLIDGRSTQEVRDILDMCKDERVIILHVTRFYSQMRMQHHHNGKFYLTDSLSLEEAGNFEKKYIKHGNAGIRKRLEKLTGEVKEGKQHSVFEYGLTAYHTEFRGVGKYVESHLRLNDKTEDWQKVAAMLSLANYYGNIALPAEFFSGILKKRGSEIVDLETDIPELGQQLIRECNDACDWKISHYLVAKEILEQYLGGGSESKSNSLLPQSCKKLHRLATDLLDCAKHHMGSQEDIRDEFTAIFNTIFIVRHDKEEVDPTTPKKALTYSRLITDVSDPDQQRGIFEKLAEYFPTNAQFCAHLGRFYSKIKQHSKAVSAMNKAVNIRHDALEAEGLVATKNGDEVMYKIQSMFGYAYNARIRELFGNTKLSYLAEVHCNKMSKEDIAEVYQCALEAVDKFRKCREYSCPSVKPSYGFIGEIQVRLQMTEFCKKKNNYKLLGIANERNDLHQLWKFIEDSFVECDSLLDQCVAAEGENQYILGEIKKYLELFSDYFKVTPRNFSKWAGDGKSLASNRRRLTLKKIALKQGRGREFRLFEDLTRPLDISEFLLLLENVLDDKESKNIRLSPYMEDWLKAVRFHDKCSLALAQNRVERWCNNKEKESLAIFYKYVLKFTETLFSRTNENFRMVAAFKTELEESKRSFRQNIVEKPLERIKHIPGSMREPSMILFRHWEDRSTQQPRLQDFHVFRGCVVEARPWYGQIELDGIKLRLFFVPRKFGIQRYHAKERRRVEFIVGFNLKQGAQAYHVNLIQAVACAKCHKPFEKSQLPSQCLYCHTPC